LKAYQDKFKDYPRLGSVVGYSAIMSLAAGIKKAQSTETEKLIAAFTGLNLMTPFGAITYRPEDHQSTMGSFVGRTKNEGGKGVMVDFRFLDGAKFLPSAEEVKKLRPAQ
jgi:branched-chain amino acid transport system substrate-binding protein